MAPDVSGFGPDWGLDSTDGNLGLGQEALDMDIFGHLEM